MSLCPTAPLEKEYYLVPPSGEGILSFLNKNGVLATDLSLDTLVRCPSARHPAANGKNAAYMVWQNGPDFFLGWCQVHDADTGMVWYATKPPENWTKGERAWVTSRQRGLAATKKIEQQEALLALTEFYARLRTSGDNHPYLQDKCVRPNPSFRLYLDGDTDSFPWLNNSLIIPYFDVNGNLMTLQAVAWEKSMWGKKYLYPGAPKTAAALLFGPERTCVPKKVGIAEGFATADSFARAMDYPCFAAIDGGNMSAVADALRSHPKYKDYHIIIAADNDIENPKNPGLAYALKAAASAKTESIAVPVLGNLSVDFNDLYVHGGDDLVRCHAMFPKTPQEVKALAHGAPSEEPQAIAAPGQPVVCNLDNPPAYPLGLYYVFYTKQGAIASAERIGSRLDVLGLTYTEEGGELGRLVTYTDIRGQQVRRVVPESALRQQGSAVTLSYLPGYDTVRAAQKYIPAYINDTPPEEEYIILKNTGWRRDGNTRFFALPGDTLEFSGKKYMYEVDTDSNILFTKRGTLKGWQDTVCALSSGNPHLILALTEALAAPLRGYLGSKMFAGWNIVGSSQIGKTLCLQAGASCYGRGTTREIEEAGRPEGAVMKWSATKNGVEHICHTNNHLCLFLDELGEMAIGDPVGFSSAIYMVMNGEGKRRMDKDANARPILYWRVSVCTASEASLASYLTARDLQVYSGQENRIYDIPAVESLRGPKDAAGLFTDLHGHKTLFEFGRAMGSFVKENYGHALPLFLGFLAHHEVSADLCQQYLSREAVFDFFQIAENAPRDQILMATKLSVNRLALHLGITAGIFPWEQEAEELALKRVFSLWVDQFDDRGKALRSEERKILDHWEAFLQRNLWRFVSRDNDVLGKDAVGVYRTFRASNRSDEYCVFTSVFKRNCLDPRRYKQELKVLGDVGMFLPSTQKGRGFATKVAIPGRKDSVDCFVLRLRQSDEDALDPKSFPEPDENMEGLPF